MVKRLAVSQNKCLSETESEKLEELQHCFTLAVSADYQQSKLIPSWGSSEQPGSTYFLRKVSHDIFGVVDHRQKKSAVFIIDERLGPKNTDHTISFLTTYWERVTSDYPWMRRWHIFLDNATSTNKNKYLFGWAMEMVSNGTLDHLHINFMIAGHTKFAPDRLFSSIGSAYKAADIFTVDELQSLCAQSAQTVVIEKGENTLAWRETISTKYSDLPGVRTFHDFLIVMKHDGAAVMKVREHCYHGPWKDSPLHVISSAVSVTPTTTYVDRQCNISSEKMANMILMYDLSHLIIVQTTCPHWLSGTLYQLLEAQVLFQTLQAPVQTAIATSTSTTRKRKRSKCSVEGCNGTGHRNPAKWNQGHTTKAGCPIFHRQEKN